MLLAALALWATDFAHGIHPGWVGLGAGIAALLPGIGVIPISSFYERRKLNAFFYMAGVLGLGAVVVHSGLARALGEALEAGLELDRGADALNFTLLAVLSTAAGALVTNPAQPVLLAPLASHFADATGWPLKAALMSIALGITTAVFPYQVPPMILGMQIADLKQRRVFRITVPVAVVSLFILLPLDYLWWRLIGYFG
jgi:di/tricarboxylate transporter